MRPSVGLVLSGGGARGAYEVGALLYLAEHYPEILEHVRVVSGSSVGAVNGVYLAAKGMTPTAVEELADLWRGLSVDDLVSLSSISALRILGAAPMRLLRLKSKSPARGILDGEGLWRLVIRSIDWNGIHRHLAEERFDAISVLATDVATGRSHAFLERRPGVLQPPDSGEVTFIPTRLGRSHVLASAAIPLLFPPIRVRGRWYMDGGIRNNTPFSPALRLGSRALMLVNVTGPNRQREIRHEFPGIGAIVGKLLDAVFLDRIAYDLDRLERINDFLEVAERIGSVEGCTQELVKMGRPIYRRIPFAVVSPTQDLGVMAADYVSEATHLTAVSFLRVLSALFSDDIHASGDGASFLLFDGGYAEKLMAHGYKDAAAQRYSIDALYDFCESPEAWGRKK